VDGQDIAAFEQGLSRRLEDLRAELQSGDYRPRAVRRVFVPKPNGGLRPLAVWALRDRVAQRAVYDFLEPHFEPQFMDCSHGFRPRRSVQTATQAVLAARDDGLTSVLDADIKDCFDRIDSRRLVGIIRHRVHDDTVLTLLERWLAADILDQRGRRTAAGAAQGGVLSPLLCNIYLHPFDRALTGRRIRLVRYADDLVCFSHSKGQVQEARGAVELELGKLGLALHPQKTRLSSFEEGFAFLGVFFLRHEHFILAPGATWRADAGRSGGSLKRKVR
jgi:group II intron reverse transcriptase/maturase